jgi:microcystin-dependent protein
MRLIKQVLQNTFPHFTDVALNSAQAEIDAAVAAVTGGTVAVGAGAVGTPSLNVNGQGGLYSPAAQQVGMEANGATVQTWNSDGSSSFEGNVTAAGTVDAANYAGGAGQLMPTGAVVMWANPTIPAGYLLCNGRLVSRTTFATLFGVIGTTYGVGDGSTTFAVPNLIGRAPVGVDSAQSILTGATAVGDTLGEAAHTLSTTELPSHNHTATSSVNDPGHVHSSPSLFAALSGGDLDVPNNSNNTTLNSNSATTGITVSTTINNTGGGGAHNNVQPSFAVNFIIKT